MLTQSLTVEMLLGVIIIIVIVAAILMMSFKLTVYLKWHKSIDKNPDIKLNVFI